MLKSKEMLANRNHHFPDKVFSVLNYVVHGRFLFYLAHSERTTKYHLHTTLLLYFHKKSSVNVFGTGAENYASLERFISSAFRVVTLLRSQPSKSVDRVKRFMVFIEVILIYFNILKSANHRSQIIEK
uniref:Helitron_like_N domain-containing protein n=1 Tax=Heterorhabditis bacteriophora TaxID=37862 RepID=A0A1I7WYZ3_HETBA